MFVLLHLYHISESYTQDTNHFEAGMEVELPGFVMMIPWDPKKATRIKWNATLWSDKAI